MNRIEERLRTLQKNKRKAFINYMTAGLPDMEGMKELIRVHEKAGTDILELGIPFSDPTADGPVIQDASYRSIQKGTNVRKVFEAVEEVRKDCGIPIVFMMYYNTIMHYGIEAFVKKCAAVGVDGLIIPDLPLEEQFEIAEVMEQTEGAPLLIQLVAPVSADRIPKIVKNARGYIYCVSNMGVTGQAAEFHKNVKEYLMSVKQAADIPVMMGFGIRTAKDVEGLMDSIDGCIVGTHFMRLMEENSYDPEVAAGYITDFKKELDREFH